MDNANALVIDITDGGGHHLVCCTGELDAASAVGLDAAVEALGPDAVVVFDLAAVSFLDSSGVRVIAQTARRLPQHGGSFSIVAASDVATRILELTGLDDLIIPA